MRLTCLLIAVVLTLTFTGSPQAQLPEFCGSVTYTAGAIEACPAGDGSTLLGKNMVITVTILENGQPASLDADQVMLISPLSHIGSGLVGCDDTSTLMIADNATNGQGVTTFSLAFSSKTIDGFLTCPDYLQISTYAGAVTDCTTGEALEVPVAVRSVDLNKDGNVGLPDLSTLAFYLNTQGDGICADFNDDGTVNNQDVATFAFHFPAHACP